MDDQSNRRRCDQDFRPLHAPQWKEIELRFKAENGYDKPYTDLDLEAVFTHEDGICLRRPAFWDGGNDWVVRFASPLVAGRWAWRLEASVADAGFDQSGVLKAAGSSECSNFERRGLLRMSPGGLNVQQADGTPVLLVADTAWALPWRATLEDCEFYAAYRTEQGFNACLLMCVQPDMGAEGPENRSEDLGFARGFVDLPDGHINELIPEYFRYFDRLRNVLLTHGIIPVYQPLFHGFGWKGQGTIGQVAPTSECARFARYLVARFGARPAIYLAGGDGHGREPGVMATGEAVEACDCYGQPTGIHYNPMADNTACQDCGWLDFQWCQTGHDGEHRTEKLGAMVRARPQKAVANGESTYERIGDPNKATGWWQGHEAWLNLTAGGTMGVFYGAGSLWQWRLHRNEPGHPEWCSAQDSGWREALCFEGAGYVGLIGRILADMPFADMAPELEATLGKRSLFVPGRFLLVYMENGGNIPLLKSDIPRNYRIVNARTGGLLGAGRLAADAKQIDPPRGVPCVALFY